nr:tetratricopeptide repeat protein [Tissierella sp.]
MISLQEELKRLKKESANIKYNDALELVRASNISKAVEVMEESLKFDDKDGDILNLIGLCHYILCNFDKASAYWAKSLKLELESNRARYYLETLNSDEYKSFIEYYKLSLLYIDKFQYKDAIELLIQINKTHKDLIDPYAIIGISYNALGENQLAKQYLEKALSRDVDNIKYLKYLNKVNGSMPMDSKSSKAKSNNSSPKSKEFNYKVLALPLAALILIGGIFFYQKYTKDMKNISNELDKIKTENSKLEEQLKNKDEEEPVLAVDDNKESEKPEKDEKEEVEKEPVEKEEVEKQSEEKPEELSFSGREEDVLLDAMNFFRKKDYLAATKRFKYLIEKSSNDDLISESMYFAGLSFEIEKKPKEAAKYYKAYIDNYRKRSYYDDALYNYGLMLHENGDIKGAKKILNKLKVDEPSSEFINSKVRAILAD